MAKSKILVVDDEEDILELLRYNLSREGHVVTTATSGEQALSMVAAAPPDAVILDLMLPGVDGLDLCKTLKSNVETVNIPIIMITAKDGEADVVTGLELGADDYITKPFSPRVVVARLKAVLRRASAPEVSGASLNFGPLTILSEKHEVRIDGQPIDLTATEFRILQMLSRRPGWVFSREQILEFAQSGNSDVTGRSVDVHIVSLRRKLAQVGEFVETVRGVGYRFRDLRHG